MSSSIVKESVVLSFWCGPGYKACRKMACRKMNEYVAYARNTESGCKKKSLPDQILGNFSWKHWNGIFRYIFFLNLSLFTDMLSQKTKNSRLNPGSLYRLKTFPSLCISERHHLVSPLLAISAASKAGGSISPWEEGILAQIVLAHYPICHEFGTFWSRIHEWIRDKYSLHFSWVRN